MVAASQAYPRQLLMAKTFHTISKTWSGMLVRTHAFHIKGMLLSTGSTSLLDYGCGKGEQYNWTAPQLGINSLAEYWGVPISKYDPAVPEFSAEPQPHDAVICTNVLGWLPKQDLGWVVEKLYKLSNKALYIAERLGARRKSGKKTPYYGAPINMPDDWSVSQWLELLQRKDLIGDREVIVALRDEQSGAWGRYWL